jgi:hypothetical protein
LENFIETLGMKKEQTVTFAETDPSVKIGNNWDNE